MNAKVWEETWEPDEVEPDQAERAKLAAAAPEMARLLLELQHHPAGYEYEPECPVCGMAEKCDRKSWPTAHVADCRLLAVLRKAGVLP